MTFRKPRAYRLLAAYAQNGTLDRGLAKFKNKESNINNTSLERAFSCM